MAKDGKFGFIKLSEDAPEQHLAILVVAFIAIFVSVIDAIKKPSDQPVQAASARQPYSVSGKTLYKNPVMSLFQKKFCRGYQRAWFCSYKNLHPYTELLERRGHQIKDAAPEKDIIIYRGPLEGNKSLSGKIQFSKP